jgi:hypothetical protein
VTPERSITLRTSSPSTLRTSSPSSCVATLRTASCRQHHLDGELGEPGGNIGCGDGDGDLGAAYGRPASSMVGTNKDSAKAQKHTGGCKMLDTLLSEARKSGDKTPVMRHFQDLSYRLSNSTIMPYNAKATRLCKRWYGSYNCQTIVVWRYKLSSRTDGSRRLVPCGDLVRILSAGTRAPLDLRSALLRPLTTSQTAVGSWLDRARRRHRRRGTCWGRTYARICEDTAAEIRPRKDSIRSDQSI